MKNVLRNLAYLQVLFLSLSCSKGTGEQQNIDSINTHTVGKSSIKIIKSDSDTVAIITGIIQSTGLSKREKNTLELVFSDFQLIGNKLVFLEGNQNFKSFWGRCAEVRGKFTKGWSIDSTQIHGQYNYGRIAFIVHSIKELSVEECSFSFALTPKLSDLPREILKGKIKRSIRPAPDIDYDYKLVFDEPYLDINHNNNNPTKINFMLLSGYDFNMQKQLEVSIAEGSTIEIEGYKEMGYAETSHFRITRVKNNLKAILN